MSAVVLRGRWVVVGGRRIHVREARPTAPGNPAGTAVLVHGYMISGRYMRPLARVMAERGWTAVAPDLPGYGRSEGHEVPPHIPRLADWLRRTMVAAGVPQPAAVIGNSMGCQVAVRLALDSPESVDRLVLVGPTFDPEASLLRHALRLVADMPRERLRLWALHVPDYVRAGLPRAVATLRAAREHRIEEDLPRLAVPTLVVRGARDPVAPAAWIERAASLVPGGTAATVPGAPHAANYSAPAALADAIAPFLR